MTSQPTANEATSRDELAEEYADKRCGIRPFGGDAEKMWHLDWYASDIGFKAGFDARDEEVKQLMIERRKAVAASGVWADRAQKLREALEKIEDVTRIEWDPDTDDINNVAREALNQVSTKEEL